MADDSQNPVARIVQTKFLGEEAWHWGVFIASVGALLFVWGRTMHYLGGGE